MLEQLFEEMDELTETFFEKAEDWIEDFKEKYGEDDDED